ncbi:twin-arginine translocase TatA/TatE family subunit [Streptomyces zingiberis]|uniref:Twin-arginine translocase TatA/TatE family subunit n=1 Tax=Streptomyces zingiberis TaxID=2053010 RepID=A0ABX1BR84_9ACTN|nr:twin-arginine translocase TatA/TatE family subunit [Streptomyces zingiberis]NJQ00227.1 twin-arginine translocase TatA/TatE family subunit [Streptomyces zingiberis]
MFGLSELAVLLIVVIVVLGAKKLPELTRSAGKAARILKSERRAMKEEGERDGAGPEPRIIRATPEPRGDAARGTHHREDGSV